MYGNFQSRLKLLKGGLEGGLGGIEHFKRVKSVKVS